MADVVMPRLSDSMEEGTIIRWLRGDGEAVSRGDELVEIETDKATMTYEADQDGTLAIVAGEGDTLPIGEVIARIGGSEAAGASGGDPAEAGAGAGAPAAQEPPGEAAPAEAEAAPAPSSAASESRPGSQAPAVTAEEPTPEPAPAETATQEAARTGERIKASPVARRMARELGVELGAVAATGPGGRVIKADVEAAADGARTAGPAAAPPQPEPAVSVQPAAASPAGAKGEVVAQEPNRTQALIARRMAEAKATVPEFTLSTDIDMEACLQARAQLKATAREGGAVPSYNDMIVKAVALALREHPRANGAYRDGHFESYSRVNVGVAVAGEGTLVVPTVFDADRLGLSQLAAETRRLAARVRDGSVTPPELSGATFTVSNLGMFGVTSFTAIINPPQAGILAVGAVEPRAVPRGNDLAVRHTMSVTLACDHRILYGADAALFLARIRSLLEAPLSLAG